jgi:hypothetical protein|tara:strand:- start:874 stop:1857 length:984 start_codon:yes stop_codon:yes gene_type:complete
MANRSETRTYNALLTTTMQEYMPTLQDNIFIEEPLLSWYNGKLGKATGKAETPKRVLSGGESILEPILYESNSTVDSYSGAETIDTTLQDGMSNAKFSWSQYSGTVGITGLEKRSNRGKHALINLLGAKTTQLESSLSERLSTDLWAASVGNSGKNISGLPLHVSNTSATGGLATTDLGGTWLSPVTDTITFSSAGVTKMDNMYNQLRIQGGFPRVIFTSPTVYELYNADQQGQKRYTNTMVMDAGFLNVTFNEVPLIFDNRCTAGAMYFLDPRHLKWCVHSEADFTMDSAGFQTPIGQDVSMTKILFMGQTTVNNRRRLGYLTSIT